MEKKTKKDERGGLLRQSRNLRRRQMMAKSGGQTAKNEGEANGEANGEGRDAKR